MTTAPPADSETNILDFPTRAAADRERTVAECESHDWRGLPLSPWGRGLQTLYARLSALDVPGGDLEDIPRLRTRYEELQAREPSDLTFEQCVNFDLYLPAATKVIFLAAVPQQEWFHLRGQPARLLARMEEWGAEHIGDADKAAACLLASQILTEHRAVMPMLRQQESGRKRDSGN